MRNRIESLRFLYSVGREYCAVAGKTAGNMRSFYACFLLRVVRDNPGQERILFSIFIARPAPPLRSACFARRNLLSAENLRTGSIIFLAIVNKGGYESDVEAPGGAANIKTNNFTAIYPEDLAFPLHPNPSLTAHLQEAFVDLKANEARIANSPTTN